MQRFGQGGAGGAVGAAILRRFGDGDFQAGALHIGHAAQHARAAGGGLHLYGNADAAGRRPVEAHQNSEPQAPNLMPA